MNNLLQHFKPLTTHPKNAQELKGLVLQLAIQGKLTKQWREERRLSGVQVEPASVLLEKIAKEKAQLIKEKKIKKEKPLAEITEDEIPFALPKSWGWCRIGDITTIKGGKRIPKGFQLSDIETPYIYIRVTDMKDGTVLFNKLKYISEDIYEIIKQYTISKNDLYITIAGTIGDVGEIPEELDNMNLTENAAKIVLYQLDKYYMKLMLRSNLCRAEFLDKVNQLAQPKLALHRIASTLVPIPPLEEQKAIVEVVNQLFAEIEELEQQTKARVQLKADYVVSALQQLANGNTAEEWKNIQTHFSTFFTEKAAIKKLRESILQLAVQGKLTKDWRAKQKAVVTLSILRLKQILVDFYFSHY
jgi:type I restriction enzyme S subunit